MGHILLPVFNGISQGMVLFLVASGLTLVFGVMGVLNFAHGAFFALGGYLTYQLAAGNQHSALVLFGLILLGAVIVGVLGLVAEVLVFRRLYQVSEINSLLGTYALLLMMQGLIRERWGVNPVSQPQSAVLNKVVNVLGVGVPIYDIVLAVIGFAIAAGLWYIVQRTEYGRVLRATSRDRVMSRALGINVPLVFTVTFVAGAFLAGIGGGLVAPLISVSPDLAVSFIIQAFIVVIIGGLGSIPGAFAAALLLGLLNAFMVSYAPALADFSLYMAMAVFLLARPAGLFGSGRTLSL